MRALDREARPETSMICSDQAMPLIFVLERERDRLTSLLDSGLAAKLPDQADALRGELDRAVVMACESMPWDAVTMHSGVLYLDEQAKRVSRVTIVYPWEVDLASGRISILAPLATALFGLRIGSTIVWDMPSGRRQTWRVLGIDSGDRV